MNKVINQVLNQVISRQSYITDPRVSIFNKTCGQQNWDPFIFNVCSRLKTSR